MITPTGYKLLSMLPRNLCCFSIYLLSAFDLRAFIALNPMRLKDAGVNDGWFQEKSDEMIIQYIDSLVKVGFLEYGPAVRGWGGKSVQTVRIVQKFILTKRIIRGTARRVKQRAERTALLV